MLGHASFLFIATFQLAMFIPQTAQQYEEFVHNFNKRIRDKNTTLDSISSKLNGRTGVDLKKINFIYALPNADKI